VGEFHVNADAMENVYDRITSFRVERIDEICHKNALLSRIQFYRLSYTNILWMILSALWRNSPVWVIPATLCNPNKIYWYHYAP